MTQQGGERCYIRGEPLHHSIDTRDPELLRLATQGEIGGVVLGGPTQAQSSHPGREARKNPTQGPGARSGSSKSDSPRSEEVTSGPPRLSGGKGSWRTNTLEFFWGSQSPFSQHHKASFKLEGLTFSCAEQYMMYRKAMVFGAKDFASGIMQTNDSAQMKKLGRLIPNFDEKTWDKECYEVVKTGAMAKFSQNPRLREQLLATHPRQLVEASPHDKKWGIGIASDHPLAVQPDQWPGENLLGKILTEVRAALL